MSQETSSLVVELRDEAVGRLMTVIPRDTPEERRIYAEWIVDAIVRAAVVDVTQRMIDANREVTQ